MTNLLTSLTVLFLLSLVSGQSLGQESNKAHKDSLIAIVEQYYDLNLKVFQAGSKPSDIDKIFDLFTDDFTYSHPKYGGVYSREDLYNGYTRNQENGSYDGKVVDIIIVNKIVGVNAMAIEKRFVEATEDGTKEGGLEMTLFEFRKGKISRIFEYW